MTQQQLPAIFPIETRAVALDDAAEPNSDSLCGHNDVPRKPPMLIDFLRAADGTPFTKKFTKAADGTIDVEPFPNIRDIDSFREEASSIEELFTHITTHAAQKHCMIKGRLARQLQNESRAGMTDPNSPTQWLLLDLDFDSGWPNVDEFLAELNPEWSDVSYIWQHSSSAGIKATPGLRGHIWLMLETPVAPASIKLWLKSRNLEMEGLRKHMTLTATGMSVKWPLDITTCGNDKLIYIAPPMLEGLADPLTERITLVKKSSDWAPPPCAIRQATVDTAQEGIVTELRVRAGYLQRRAKYSNKHDFPLLTNPDPAIVTGEKRARGFTYLNLNGGDSWGYYFPEDNPELLYNFKDEPVVRLQTLAPEYYANYKLAQRHERYGNVQPYVFRNPANDTYYNILHNLSEDKMPIFARVASKDRMKDFLSQYGAHLPGSIPDWTIAFDPQTTKIIDPDGKWVNLFVPTEYLRSGKALSAYPQIPPVTDKILTSVVGGCQVTKAAFINWLACLIQTRAHLGTAWLFHGVPGTGKGLLLSKILTPILGKAHVTEWTTKEFEDPFNAALEHTCLLWLDEFRASNAHGTDSLMARLKNLITEDTLPIRAMRTDTAERPNFVNVIIASNSLDPVLLADTDRRFNVAPAQEQPLRITGQEVNAIEDELWLFTSFLMNQIPDFDQGRTVLLNDARTQMIESSQTTQDLFFAAVRNGDIDYFIEFLDDILNPTNLVCLVRYAAVLKHWIQCLLDKPDEPPKCTREDLYTVFQYIVGRTYSPAKFARVVNSQRGLKIIGIDIDRKTHKGLCINFKVKDRAHLEQIIASKFNHGLKVIQGGKED